MLSASRASVAFALAIAACSQTGTQVKSQVDAATLARVFANAMSKPAPAEKIIGAVLLRLHIAADGHADSARIVKASSSPAADGCIRSLKSARFPIGSPDLNYLCELFDTPTDVGAPVAPLIVPERVLDSDDPAIAQKVVPVDALAVDASLSRLFPPALAARNVEGEAWLRVRVEADGSLTPVAALEASHEEFAAACIEHVRQLRFMPARDAHGNAVPVMIKYQCDFKAADRPKDRK